MGILEEALAETHRRPPGVFEQFRAELAPKERDELDQALGDKRVSCEALARVLSRRGGPKISADMVRGYVQRNRLREPV